MTFPTIASSAGSGSAYGSSDFTATQPSGVATGNLLVAIGLRTDSNSDWTDPTGWTRIGTTSGGGWRTWVWARVATGSDAFVIVRSSSNGDAAVILCRVDNWTGTTTASVNATLGVDFSGDGNPGSVTASWGSADNTFIAYCARGGNNITAYPTGYANDNVTAFSEGNYGGIGAGRKQSAAASDDPGLGFNTGGNTVHVGTIVIRGSSSSDVTAPVLSSASGTGGALVCSGSVSSANDANGTLYAVVTASSTGPTAAQVKLGQDHTGSAALRVVSQSVTATGTQSIGSGAVTAGTRYFHFMHEDAAANQSTVATSSSFTVTAAGPTITTQPTAQTAKIGASAVFSVAATASAGSLSYQWKFNGSNVGTNIATYTRTAVVAGDHAGTVSVDVTDSNGTVSSSTVALTVAVTFSGTVPAQSGLAGGAFSLDLSSYFAGGLSRTYAVLSGTMLTGLSQVGTTAVWSGTLGAVGSGSFVVRATDSAGNVDDTGTVTWTITSGTGVVLVTDPMWNNTLAAPLASVGVHWSYFPSGRIGALTGITMVEGTGTTAADGTLTLTLPTPGLLMVTKRNATPLVDDVFYQAFE